MKKCNRTQPSELLAAGVKRVLIAPIRFYQRFISPILPPMCRFQPSCSHYAVQAIEVHGAAIGLLLAVGRFLRCNPLFPGGYDPVPQKRDKRGL
jgi:putative membrane protein insertion efficiency factor